MVDSRRLKGQGISDEDSQKAMPLHIQLCRHFDWPRYHIFPSAALSDTHGCDLFFWGTPKMTGLKENHKKSYPQKETHPCIATCGVWTNDSRIGCDAPKETGYLFGIDLERNPKDNHHSRFFPQYTPQNIRGPLPLSLQLRHIARSKLVASICDFEMGPKRKPIWVC